MALVETSWLEKNLSNIKIIDCSWHLPKENRNAFEEFTNEHIPNAIFFDLDKNSSMGISSKDEIVIYDNSDLISSCRCWYNFIYFGHNPKLVHVLNGGLKKWKMENKILTKEIASINKSNYSAQENLELVKNKEQINKNILNKKFDLVDARSKGRFQGKEPEPRKNMKSGNIKNSFNVPYNLLINEDHTFKSKQEIKNIFEKNIKSNLKEDIVFSCGSGVTAAVLALAYSLINNKYAPKLYDGSWAEYGKI